MSTEVWTVISVGIVILVAIATSHRALRQEMNERFREVNERFGKADERIADLRAEMIKGFGKVNERITAVRGELLDRITAVRGELSDRLSHVEGLLEGIGHVLRKRTGKERRGAEHGPADPQP